MSEPIQFWLDNKMSAGIKVAVIASQTLVVYREKFYLVENNAAQTRGGKAIRYSKSSLPAIWKKVLKGDSLSQESLDVSTDEALPKLTISSRQQGKKHTPQPVALESETQVLAVSAKSEPFKTTQLPGNSKKMNPKSILKPVSQTSVTVNCPECNFKHEFPLEKGKNGKPFFASCIRCKAEFAVRFVPATIYQAQVAGFK